MMKNVEISTLNKADLDRIHQFIQENVANWDKKLGVYGKDIETLKAYVDDFFTPLSFHQVAKNSHTQEIEGVILGKFVSTFGPTKESQGLPPVIKDNNEELAIELIKTQEREIREAGVTKLVAITGPSLNNTERYFEKAGYEFYDTYVGQIWADVNTLNLNDFPETDLFFDDFTPDDLNAASQTLKDLGKRPDPIINQLMEHYENKSAVLRTLWIDDKAVALIYLSTKDHEIVIEDYIINWEHQRVIDIATAIYKELVIQTKKIGVERLRITRRLNSPSIDFLKKVGFTHEPYVTLWTKEL